MKQIVIIEKTATGYGAYFEDIENAAVGTTGTTLDELRKNIEEVYEFYLEEHAEQERKEIELSLDIPSMFDFFPVINKTEFAKYIGMNRSLLSQYMNGIKIPNEATSLKVIEGFRKLREELAVVA